MLFGLGPFIGLGFISKAFVDPLRYSQELVGAVHLDIFRREVNNAGRVYPVV